jgi:hypothetical protein
MCSNINLVFRFRDLLSIDNMWSTVKRFGEAGRFTLRNVVLSH